jgi:hypothetical protein
MGWNSWDCFGPSVTEDEVRRNAEVIAGRLADLGWEYVVVDIQWCEPQARARGYRPYVELVLDEVSRPQPAPNRAEQVTMLSLWCIARSPRWSAPTWPLPTRRRWRC